MEKLSLKQIQSIQVDILSVIADICEKNNLRYFLYYGTLIGAIRHKGFIPWDDDLDICMPRPDYEKLIEYFKINEKDLQPLKLEHYRFNKKYIFPITRVSNTNYYVEYDGKKDYGLGIFIDIYPFDGCGNSIKDVERIYSRTKNLISIISSGGNIKFEKSPNGIIRNTIKWLLYKYTSIFGLHKIIKKLDKIASKRNFDEDKYVNTTVWWTSTKYIQERQDINDLIYVEFEGKKFKTIRNYDKFLRKRYGDYMKMPSENQRFGHHFYTVYKK